MANPILIEVTRGPLVESWHRGAIAVSDSEGLLALKVGNVSEPIYPRSAIKALQALPLIESGAADHFGYGPREIALACASHIGTEMHTTLADEMLHRAGLSETALGCGAHVPLGAAAAKELYKSGHEPNQLHNNCSGKHAGMLATAIHLGESTSGYWKPDHPVQRRVLHAIEDMCGERLGPDVEGIDGCSVPNWAMPLSVMARMFARLVTGDGLAPQRRQAIQRILGACWEHPELIAGPRRTDTVVLQKLPERVFIKTGAEGVYCGAFPKLGLGFALKIDDGAKRAASGTAMALIEQIYPLAPGLPHQRSIKSWRGDEVATIRSSIFLEDALQTLKR